MIYTNSIIHHVWNWDGWGWNDMTTCKSQHLSERSFVSSVTLHYSQAPVWQSVSCDPLYTLPPPPPLLLLLSSTEWLKALGLSDDSPYYPNGPEFSSEWSPRGFRQRGQIFSKSASPSSLLMRRSIRISTAWHLTILSHTPVHLHPPRYLYCPLFSVHLSLSLPFDLLLRFPHLFIITCRILSLHLDNHTESPNPGHFCLVSVLLCGTVSIQTIRKINQIEYGNM